MKLLNIFRKNISISFGITVNDEVKEIEMLLESLIPQVEKQDEIIVLQDVTNKNTEVSNILNKYQNKIHLIEAKLDGDFAKFKNNIVTKASKNYLFQIDADELPPEKFVRRLKLFIIEHRKTDVFSIPRINIVKGLTEEYLQKMGWKKNRKGYINFPDFQHRIFKLGTNIKWENKVHERLVSFSTIQELPIDESFCLLHIKSFERQKKQNEFYEIL